MSLVSLKFELGIQFLITPLLIGAQVTFVNLHKRPGITGMKNILISGEETALKMCLYAARVIIV